MRARVWRRALAGLVQDRPTAALLLASAVGWAAMLWFAASADPTHAAHTAHSATHAVASGSSPQAYLIWIAMVLAMAPLLLVREVGRLWRGSLRRGRHGTIAAFLCGYGLLWMALGAAVVPLANIVSASVGLIWLAVAFGALWQCSPTRQRFLNICHRRPSGLRVFGAAARWDAMRYGVTTGGACAASCGPLMLLVLVAVDYHLVAMTVVTIASVVERYLPARRPSWRLPFLAASSPEWLGVR